jgi:hypothetical protein
MLSVSVYSIQLLNQLTDYCDIKYGIYVIGDLPEDFFLNYI